MISNAAIRVVCHHLLSLCDLRGLTKNQSCLKARVVCGGHSVVYCFTMHNLCVSMSCFFSY